MAQSTASHGTTAVGSTQTEWSLDEVVAAVDGYLTMLAAEKAGEGYSKAAVNRGLRDGPLRLRSRPSVEYRMRNISWVLQELGRPWISGYKPASNVGVRVRKLIEEAISRHA